MRPELYRVVSGSGMVCEALVALPQAQNCCCVDSFRRFDALHNLLEENQSRQDRFRGRPSELGKVER